RLFLPANSRPPKEHTDYTLSGTLTEKPDQSFVFKPKKGTKWQSIPGTHTFALWRYGAKQHLKRLIRKEMQNKTVQAVLAVLATGEIDERLLSIEFGKVGLQHILAISGFHFALMALFAYGLLRLICPRCVQYPLLLALLTGYYFFLGNAPSIQRAYVMIAL